MTPEQEQKLNDVHHALLGNEKLGHEGLVKTVRRHDVWIADARVRISYILGGATVIGFVANRRSEEHTSELSHT